MLQRALFLNDDDLEAAKTWLEGQRSGGSTAPGHLSGATSAASPTAANVESGLPLHACHPMRGEGGGGERGSVRL